MTQRPLPQPGLSLPRARLRLFVSRQQGRRTRRTTDLLLAVAAGAGLLVVCSGASELSDPEQHLVDAVESAPGFLGVVWQFMVVALAAWIVLVAVAAVVGRRGGPLADMVLGGAVATLIWVVVDRVDPLVGGTEVPWAFACACGVLASVRPQLRHPFRRLGRYVVIADSVVLVLLARTTPTGSLLCLLIGVLAASGIHLLIGTPDGLPGPEPVAEALRGLGLEVVSVIRFPERRAGVVTFRAEEGGETGGPVVVRVYGRDARDSQLLSQLARSLWYREEHGVLPTRIQQAEHEAFVTLLAGTYGARVSPVRAVGRTSSGDALVAFGAIGSSVETADSGRVSAMWQQMDLVHRSGLALRDVASTRFVSLGVDDVGMGDLSTAGLLRDDDDVVLDRAQLVVGTARWVGSDVALDIARASLGEGAFARMVPYLQPAALGPELRRQLQTQSPSVDVDQLRDAAAELVGIDSPRIAQIRRVTAGSLIQMVLMTFAAYAVISLLGGVDVDELISTLSGASWPWVLAALIVGQTTVMSETVSTQGASARRLAAGPLVALQVAIGFVKLAVPSSAARMGMVLRYFQKQGVPAPMALSISAIETFTGFLVQLLLLGLVVGVGSVEMALPETPASSAGNLMALLVTLVVAAGVMGVVVAVVPGLRARVIERFRPWLGEASAATDALRSPIRLLQLVGGNAVTQVMYALALSACVVAFGSDIDLGAALAVYVVAALFGGFMPVPGGIGVMEAALTVGLVAVGVGESAALAAAITFRIVTFYVPPLWGWASFRWLERNRYL